MSDWRPRLIATDMDGTLLRRDDSVSEVTIAELSRWTAEGVPLVLATGRPPRWMREIRKVVPIGTAVCCNGAVLLDLERFEILEETALQPDRLRVIIDELRDAHDDMWFAVEYGFEFRHEPHYKPRWDIDVPGVAEATVDEMVQAPAAKLLVRSETMPRDAFVELVSAVVGDTGTVTNSSGDALAEVSAPGVTKATGLAHVAAAHGVDPADIVYFGDMPNDVAAFEWVREAGGRAVAMAHAHPEALAAATDVTLTNDQDGIAAFLRGLS